MMDYKPDSNPLKSLIFLVRERVDEVKSRTDLVVICSDETFVSLSKGAISPEFAYLRQLLKLKGSAQVGLDFFKFYLDEIISKEQSK